MRHLFYALSLALMVSPLASAKTLPELPRLKIDKSRITVTGLSSGAFMAVQLGIAHSELFSGVGVFAGGAYGCAYASPADVVTCMSKPSEIDVAKLVSFTHELVAAGDIPSLEKVAEQKIYLLSGRKDPTTPPAANEKLKEYLEQIGARDLLVRSDLEAGHGQPTLNSGIPCSETGSPWILNCNFDSAGEVLSHFYGPLKGRGQVQSKNMKSFSQSRYKTDAALMSDTGSIYVPKSCRMGSECGLVVALHGCRQAPELLGNEYRDHAGYNEWAETNGLVVLYPSTKVSKYNPNACWDWWGYTGREYLTRKGPQIEAIRRMIEAIAN